MPSTMKLRFLKKIFDKKPKLMTALAKNIVNLKRNERLLAERQLILQKKIEKLNNKFIENAARNQKAALQALRQKHLYERKKKQLERLMAYTEDQRIECEITYIKLKAAEALSNKLKVNNPISDICDSFRTSLVLGKPKNFNKDEGGKPGK